MNFFSYINRGGPINWVLFGLMCIVICISLERSIYFFSTNAKSKKSFLLKFKNLCHDYENKNYEIQKNELEQQETKLFYEMTRGLWILNLISAIAPSIGLLGTVVGLISSFQSMAIETSSVNIQSLSGGIWVAMITTEFGMLISIPTIFIHKTFKRIAEKRMVKINFLVQDQLTTSGEK